MHKSIQVFVIKFLVIFCKFNSKVFIYLFIIWIRKLFFFLIMKINFFILLKQ